MTLQITRGDDFAFEVSLSSEGQPIDLTGHTIYFTVKKNITNDLNDELALIKVTVDTFNNPESGKQIIEVSRNLTNIAPGNYEYDIQIKTPDSIVATAEQFPLPFIVKGDVTRRI